MLGVAPKHASHIVVQGSKELIDKQVTSLANSKAITQPDTELESARIVAMVTKPGFSRIQDLVHEMNISYPTTTL